jgi:hypothetical protein
MPQKKQVNGSSGDNKKPKKFKKKPVYERIYGCHIKPGSSSSGISVAGILAGNYRRDRTRRTNGNIGHKGGLHRG